MTPIPTGLPDGLEMGAQGLYGVGASVTIRADRTAVGEFWPQLFQVDDIVETKGFIGWGDLADTYYRIDTVTVGSDYDEYGATVVHGRGNVTYPAGTPIVGLGPGYSASDPGSGYIILDAQTDRGPSMQIVTHEGRPWVDSVVRGQIGNLAGCYGITGDDDEYGVAFGRDTSDSSQGHIVISNERCGLYGVSQSWWNTSGVLRGQVNPQVGDTGLLFWLGENSLDPGFWVKGDGSVGISKRITLADLGDLLFSQASGVGLWGPYTALTSSSWTSSQGDAATLTGTFTTVSGKHPGTRALRVYDDTYLDFSDQASMLDSQEKLTIALLVKMGHDWDDTSHTTNLLHATGTGDSLRIHYSPTSAGLYLARGGLIYIGKTGNIGDYPYRHFDAGDWLHVVVTWDFATPQRVRLYLNGELLGQRDGGVPAWSQLTIDDWTVGGELDGTSGEVAVEEIAILHAAWTQDQVAIAYNQNQPLVDVGATEQQGLYLYDDFTIAAMDGSGNITAQMDTEGFTTFMGSTATYDPGAAFKVEESGGDGYASLWGYQTNGSTYGVLVTSDEARDTYLSLTATAASSLDAEVSIMAEAGTPYASVEVKAFDTGTQHDGIVDIYPYFALPYTSGEPAIDDRNTPGSEWAMIYVDDSGAAPKLEIRWANGDTDTIRQKT